MDPNLEGAVDEELSKPPSYVPTEGDMASLTTLSYRNNSSDLSKNVATLQGLQFATQLTSLSVVNHSSNGAPPFSDLAAIGNLTGLTSLNISGNVNDAGFSDLSGLTNLVNLTLAGSPSISSLAPTANMNALRRLSLGLNYVGGCETLSPCGHITDVSPLVQSPKPDLQELYLGGQRISDISPLTSADLPALKTIDLNSNNVADIRPLSGLPKLTLTSSALYQALPRGTLYVPEGANDFSFDSATIPNKPISFDGSAPPLTPNPYDGPTYALAGSKVHFTGLTDATSKFILAWDGGQDSRGVRFSGYYRYAIARATYTNSSPKPGAVGTKYGFLFTVTAGFAPVAFKLVSGTVPGLSLRTDGRLVGIPTASGNFALTVRATDAWGNNIDKNYNLNVTAAAPSTSSPGTGTHTNHGGLTNGTAGSLANTGSDILWTSLVGLAATVGGTLLLATRRRNTHSHRRTRASIGPGFG
ncbi:leucine-rich repeat domain-containing protein [Leifsonia sp. NPDC102414]|uniref:leucine-rich repeat domain-containing protein n=1 Tax=Leifsonia sp. NPDC102414 TaxID=3364124 RepID=UPI0037F48CBB